MQSFYYFPDVSHNRNIEHGFYTFYFYNTNSFQVSLFNKSAKIKYEISYRAWQIFLGLMQMKIVLKYFLTCV